MPYKESQLDKDNFRWFQNDQTRNSLKKLKVTNGNIRSISPVEIPFEYPITAIVGENGSGKSTVLAMVACAFHNNTGFFPQNRIRGHVKKPRNYYTYGDFFMFSTNETGIAGIEICSEYLTNSGLKQDVRKKKPSGKWNDFIGRPKRAVTYMGINRIVPPSESSPHRHYYREFKEQSLEPDKLQQLKESISYVIGRNYTDIELKSHNIYQLFEAKRQGLTYTGFNMGAGENAVLGLLLEILKAGSGALIVVDEIELGLHTQAQIRLIEELKKLCNKYKCQIVCSTHSKEVLEQLPPEGRLFIRRSDDQTDIISRISPDYAFGKLSGSNSEEVSIFVEDEVAQAFLSNVLPLSIRERVRILPIGSDQAVLKHIAVHYREQDYSCLAFLDGDKRTQVDQAVKQIKTNLEDRINHSDEEFTELMKKRLKFIPGDSWPEKELIQAALEAEDHSLLAQSWNSPTEDIKRALEEAFVAEKHDEFFTLKQKMQLPIERVRSDIIQFYKQMHNDVASVIVGIRLFAFYLENIRARQLPDFECNAFRRIRL